MASAEIDENLNNWMEWRATYNNNNSTGAAFLEDLEDKVVTAPKVAINTIEKIRSTCFESLYCFVDGLEWLAVHWRESAEMRNGVYDPEDFNGQSSVDDDVLYGSSGGGGGGNGHNPNTSGSLLKLENIKDILNKDDAIIGSWWEGSEAKRKRKYGQQNKKVFGLHADIGNLDNARGAFGLGLAAKGSASALDIRKVVRIRREEIEGGGGCFICFCFVRTHASWSLLATWPLLRTK